MIVTLIISGVCTVFLFIGILGFGTGGAAVATILLQLFSAVCCFLYLRDTYPGLLCRRDDIGAHRELITRTLHFGLISALQASSLYTGKILVQGSVNTLGTPGIAAYTAASRIEGFANSFGDSGHMFLAFFGTTTHLLLRAVLSAALIGKMGLSAVAVATGLGWMLCVTYLTVNYIRLRIMDQKASKTVSYDI